MALLATLGGMCAVAVSAALFASLGSLILENAKLQFKGRAERLLVFLGVGVIAFNLIVSLGELLPKTRLGVCGSIAIAGVLGLVRLRRVLEDLQVVALGVLALAVVERWIALATIVVLFLEGFAAMAPLTGSDALHYHFAVPAVVLREGFRPDWFLTNSFLTGLFHQLILAGLALGSEKLALGWIFLGGAAAAIAAGHLARQWSRESCSFLTPILFLLTPVTFWQVTTAGAPDIWMAFLVLVGLFAIQCAKENPALPAVAVAGAIAGGVAGVKYTGLILAACLFAAFIVEVRRSRASMIFLLTALATGIWPYLRNWLWTSDPVFPFMIRHIAPERVNPTALAGMLASTGASAAHGLWQIVSFPFFAAVDRAHLGYWQLLGPLVLCFAPLILLVPRRMPLWSAAAIVWIGGTLGIGLGSGMARYALPLLPIALAAVMAGVSQLSVRRWRAVYFVAELSIAGSLLLGVGGLALYERSSWAVSAGLITRENYLRLKSPDYPKSEFLNYQLEGKSNTERILVFFGHLYYLRVPYLFGDPAESWPMDPDKLRSDEAWRLLFSRNHIRWVARGEDYPPLLREPLKRLETENVLVPLVSESIEDWSGNRIGGVRKTERITILSVAK